MKDILAEITRLRLQRGWSEYDLAKNSGLTQSTISTWYRKNQTPTIQTLDKVCRVSVLRCHSFLTKAARLYRQLMTSAICWTTGRR